MSAAVYPNPYGHEPYRLPAGLLAVAVHGAFFALLYFGFSWQTEPPATMSVELWDSIPSAPAAPPKVEEPPVEAVEPPKPESQPEPEIAIPDKKAKPQEKKVEAKPVAPPVDEAALREQAERAERAAATGRVVDEYVAKIKGKIKGKVVMPPDVPDDARAEFLVTVLPGGSVLNPRLLKSSGHAAYDNAVERAILKAQPLPLPPDAALFNRFRELRLVFRPKE
ncbi:MAG: TonB family protein [Gallionella sp.]|jgi:colicin import membrane protein|nr:TonB family protein [Gallionella sp.]MCK9353040.1 TonB family protein [Gallionella sp.]